MNRLYMMRLLRVLLHFVAGLGTCAIVFPLTDAAGRQRRIQHWSIKLLAICKVQVALRNVQGEKPPPRALIVANHVSWLDIFVINSIQVCHFVAKSDIRTWPLIGWLCEKSGTIFIARGKQRDVRRIFQGLVASIEAGDRVAFFPEGSTAAQGSMLPFHANLFEAACNAKVPVQPYALRYVDEQGLLHSAVEFIGDMSFTQSMLAILKASPIKAELIQLAPVDTTQLHRRELALTTHGMIAEALGQTKKA